MTERRKTTLGEICRRQNGSIQTGPFGSQLHASDYIAIGTPVVMPVNISDGRIDERDIARISDENVERLARHKLAYGDIVFSRRGDVTRFAAVSERETGWVCGTGCLKVSIGTPAVATSEFIPDCPLAIFREFGASYAPRRLALSGRGSNGYH